MQTLAIRLMTALAVGHLAIWACAQDAGHHDNAAEKSSAASSAKIGQDAPDFTLIDYTGKKFQLAGLKDKVVVLEWLNQQCPFSVGNVPVMNDLRKKYAGKEIVWLGVDSTFWRKPEENAQYAKDKDLEFPILMDTDGAVGRLYGAKVTPHVFVIVKGKLVYAGAVRSKAEGSKPEESSRNYLDETLTAVLDNKPVPVAETKPWGCNVKYKDAGDSKKEHAAAANKP